MRNLINLDDLEEQRIEAQIADLQSKRAKVKNRANETQAVVLAELKHSRFEIPSLNVIWIKPSVAMRRVLPKDVGAQDEFCIPLTDGFKLNITDYGVSIAGKSLVDQMRYLAKQGVGQDAVKIENNFDSIQYYETQIKNARRDRAKAEEMVREAFQ